MSMEININIFVFFNKSVYEMYKNKHFCHDDSAKIMITYSFT